MTSGRLKFNPGDGKARVKHLVDLKLQECDREAHSEDLSHAQERTVRDRSAHARE